MNYLILVIAVLVGTLHSSIWNIFSKRYLKNPSDPYAFNSISCVTSMIVLVIMSGKISIPSTYTIIMGVIFGVVTSISQLAYTKTLSSGPLSYSVLFSACGMLIPTFAGVIWWSEAITVWQLLGILLLVLSFLSGVNPKKDKKLSVIWIIFGMLTFIFNGIIGVLQKIHQSSIQKSEINEFLIVAFIVSALISGGFYLYYSKVKEIKKSFKFKSQVILVTIAVGACTGIINKTNLYLSGVLPSAVFYPIYNGSVIVLSSVVAIFIFKEKMTKLQLWSLVLGIIAILLISGI